MIPLFQTPQTIFFATVRGLNYEGKPVEGNFGLGVRHIFDNFDWMMGFYTYYDRNRTRERNFFNQITLGLELKTAKFTFDANGYIPFGKTQQRASIYDKTSLIDGVAPFKNILFKTGYEVALWGLDGEVGYEVFEGLSFFAGGFYFHRDKVETVTGPFARVNWTYDFDYSYPLLFDQFHFELGGSYDSFREWRFYTGIKFSWLIGARPEQKPMGIGKRMYEYVRRDYDIISTGNNETPLQLLEKSPGNPVNVDIVTNFAQFTNALTNGADVIAVEGEVDGALGNSILAQGQTVTGRDYVFGDNVSIQLSSGGTIKNLALQVSKDNTIRDLIGETVGITNDGSSALGTLKILNNILTNNSGSLEMIVFQVTSTDPSNIYFNNNTANFNGTLCMTIRGLYGFELTVNEFNDNTFNITPSGLGSQIGIQLTNISDMLGPNDTTGIYNLNSFKRNVVNLETSDESVAFVLENGAGGGKTGLTQTFNVLAFEENRVNIGGSGTPLNAVRIANQISNASTSANQTLNITSFTSNTFQVGDTSGAVALKIFCSQDEASASGTQSLMINTFASNEVIVGKGSSNKGISIRNTTFPSVTPQIKIGENDSGGFYNNQITLGEGSTQSIVFDNSAANGTINVKVNNFGQDLSPSNYNANISEIGTNVPGISITP